MEEWRNGGMEEWRNGGMDDGWIFLDMSPHTSSRMQSRKRVKVKKTIPELTGGHWNLGTWRIIPGLVSG